MIDLNEAGEQLRPQPAGRFDQGLADRILFEESENVATAPEGSRNDQLNRSAFALGQLVAGGVFSESIVVDSLEDAADSAGIDAHEARSTIRSGIESGKMDPRTLRDHDSALRTPEEREADRLASERRRAEAEAKILEDQARAEAWTKRFIELAGPVAQHDYLDAKQIEPCPAMLTIHADAVSAELNGFRVHGKKGELEGDLLAFPLQKMGAGKFCTTQFIDGQGRKAFLPGKRTTSGAFWTPAALPGQDSENLTFFFAEGPATVLSATKDVGGVPVAVMSDHNVEAVAKDFRKYYPKAKFIFLADIYKDTGLPNEYFAKASRAVGGFLAVPDFGPGWTADMGTDFNDLARVRGPEAVRECIERASLPVASRFEVLDRDGLMGLAPSGYIVKGIMPDRGVGVIYGPSTVGKTFLELDLAAHIAEGRAWFGLRVKAHPVAILMLEGAGGSQKRIRAWEEHRGRRYPAGVKFLPPPRGGFDLRSETDVNDLITRLQSNVGRGVTLFVDTLGQALPGGDENGGKDYSLALSMAGRIERALEGFITFIGHTGKDEQRGLRGNSNLFAGMDMVLKLTSVPGEAGRAAWTIEKSKDGEDGLTRHFRRVVVDLGQDEDGDPVTSCVIEPVEDAGGDSSARVRAMTKTDAERITAYRECAIRMGTLDDEGRFIGLCPEGWKQDFMLSCQEGTLYETRKKAFNRMKSGLIRSGWLKETIEGLLMPDGYGAHVQIETIQGALQERAGTKSGHF